MIISIHVSIYLIHSARATITLCPAPPSLSLDTLTNPSFPNTKWNFMMECEPSLEFSLEANNKIRSEEGSSFE